MQQELLTQLEEADLPAALKQALVDLAQEMNSLLPSLPGSDRWQTYHRLKEVVAEAVDPARATYWWEAYLDLMAKTAGQCGPAGEKVAEAIAWLAPLMAARLPPGEDVTLREITDDTVWGVCQLTDTLVEPRKGFVAPNAISLAEAHFNRHAWFRAVYAGKTAAGFMMIEDDDDTPNYFLWRFMIAGPYQGRGYGRQAIGRLVEYVRTRPGAKELLVSCGEGEGSPKEFYLKQGFMPTGKVIDDETVLRLPL